MLGTYREHLLPKGEKGILEVDVASGTTVGEVLEQFDIPLEHQSVILVNGRTLELDHVLNDNDVIAAFPAMAGG